MATNKMKIHSQRRGAPSLDPELSDRRKWYDDMRIIASAKPIVYSVNDEDENDIVAGETMSEAKKINSSISSISSINRSNSQEIEEKDLRKLDSSDSDSKQESAPFNFGTFSSTSLSMAEESLSRMNKSYEEDLTVVVPDFVRPSNFSPEKWIVSLNSLTAPKEGCPIVLFFPGLGGNPYHFKRMAMTLEAQGMMALGICLPGRNNRFDEPFLTTMNPLSSSSRNTDAKEVDVYSSVKPGPLLTNRNTNNNSMSGSTNTNSSNNSALYLAVGSILESLAEKKWLRVSAKKKEGKDDNDDNNDNQRVQPVILVGHSVGAIIAYETARTLELWPHVEVLAVVVSSCRTPLTLTDHNRDRFATKYFCASQKELMDRMFSLGGIPPSYQERKELLRIVLPLFRSDYEMFEKYFYTNRRDNAVEMLQAPILSLAARDDRSVEIRHQEMWGTMTKGAYHELFFPKGGHSYIFDSTLGDMVAEMIVSLGLREPIIFPTLELYDPLKMEAQSEEE